MEQMTIYNTAKHRLETVDIEITDKNSTWFDDRTDTDSIYRITDFQGGLLIKQEYCYPIWINDISRMDIDHDPRKAQALLVD